jgi:hypothetical protein
MQTYKLYVRKPGDKNAIKKGIFPVFNKRKMYIG